MICPRCADAADRCAGRDQHCDSKPGEGTRCDCQHRTDLYGTATGEAISSLLRKRPQHPASFTP